MSRPLWRSGGSAREVGAWVVPMRRDEGLGLGDGGRRAAVAGVAVVKVRATWGEGRIPCVGSADVGEFADGPAVAGVVRRVAAEVVLQRRCVELIGGDRALGGGADEIVAADAAAVGRAAVRARDAA